MALASGTRLGVYEIVTLIGSGGMGEVYRTKDTTLGRDVALKILPASFTNDPERVARFRREAQVLASLNHPHIGQIYGLDQVDGTQFLVLELVDGESLDKRIARGPIPVDEALALANQIAEALEAAHEKGIIHRDLKPANIALTKDGQVKVLDFGLAKAAEATSGSVNAMNSPTITSPAMMTGVGVILGTAAYMAPEQAKGRTADKRSDVWAFGCVLYEMLTGARPFGGADVADTLAHVLRGDPDWALLPADAAPAVVTLVKGCLVKDRARRIADVAVAKFVLGAAATEHVPSAAVAPRAKGSAIAALVSTVIGVALGGVIVGATVWRMRPQAAPRPPIRFFIGIPEGATGATYPSISADGSRLAYAMDDRIYVRSLGDLEARPLSGTEGAGPGASPALSPDGRSVAFFSQRDRAVKRIPVDGGVAQSIYQTPSAAMMKWTRVGIVFVTAGRGVVRVAETGNAEILVPFHGAEFSAWPQLLPDGRTLLVSVLPSPGTDWDKARIVAQPVGGGESTTLIQAGGNPRYLPSGHLVYALGGVLMAAPFDLRSLKVTGPAVPVLEGVRRSGVTGGALFDISDDGTLVYVQGPASANAGTQTIFATLDSKGAVDSLHLPPGAYDHPRVSPDGSRLVYGLDDGKETAIWVYELSGANAPRRLTFEGVSRYPMWSPDGERVVFQSDRDGTARLYWQRADGSDRAVPLTKPAPGTAEIPNDWSADGKILLYTTVKGSTFTLSELTLAGGRVEVFGGVRSIYPPVPAISPDGRWVAYVSYEDVGAGGIFVQPFPPTGAKYQVTSGAGIQPAWSHDGKQLFYLPPGPSLLAIPVATQPFALGHPVEIPRRSLAVMGPTTERRYDVMRDGKILGIFPFNAAQAPPIVRQYTLVLNWFEELKARVPTK